MVGKMLGAWDDETERWCTTTGGLMDSCTVRGRALAGLGDRIVLLRFASRCAAEKGEEPSVGYPDQGPSDSTIEYLSPNVV